MVEALMGEDALTHSQAQQAARRWLHLPWVRPAIIECGLPDGTRADVLGLNLRTGRIHIIEVKVNRQDFLRGREKFEHYRQWSDLFYVAAPEGLIAAHELPKGVGLLVIREKSYGESMWQNTRVGRAARIMNPLNDERRRQIEKRVLGWLLSFYESRLNEAMEAGLEWPKQDWTP